jgi:DNA-directed RNA polymerase subunit RPC12/RpoP
MIPGEPCIWEPIRWASGRISTMFCDTTCGKQGVASEDDAKYCRYCGHEIFIVTADKMESLLLSEQRGEV